jgi:hypothetical protein
MSPNLESPLSGRVNSRFGGAGKYRNKILLGAALVGVVPFALSTFAASVTVGDGPLEFGQGSQQAVACDPKVYAALSEQWFADGSDEADPSAGFFRVKAITVADLDLLSCAGKKLRVRLIDTQGGEIPISSLQDSRVIQITIPNLDVPIDMNSFDNPDDFNLTYLTGDGRVVSNELGEEGPDATAAIKVTGTSIYDGKELSATEADVTFYLDWREQPIVNIDGQYVGRTTIETVNNLSR